MTLCETERLTCAESSLKGGAMFDWSMYGLLARARGRYLGARTANERAKLVRSKTRCSISEFALYRIERGVQVPSAEQFMAINLALFGSVLPRTLDCCFLLKEAAE